MQTIVVEPHDPGDYVHPEQQVRLVDEATGFAFELYLRCNASAPEGTSEISLYIPAAFIKQVQNDKQYCVVTLSRPGSGKEPQAGLVRAKNGGTTKASVKRRK